ncbi:MAG: cysteine dioxygenase family protein [Phycisphaerales bacterium]|jgi:cysteine dioxygenase
MSTPQTTCTVTPKLADLVGYLASLRERADLGELERHLAALDLTRHDIAPACVFGTRGYRRNTIARGQWYELLALCWRSGDCTPIHDHEGSSCAFKVIEGRGTEIRYEPTECGKVCPTGRRMLEPGTVCAAEDDDIHQVANMQAKGVDLITLHIYSPPIKQMGTYDFATGEVTQASPDEV